MSFELSEREFHITLLNEKANEEIVLKYQLYSTSFLESWIKVFYESCFAENQFGSMNFAGQPFEDHDLVVAQLNGIILKINTYAEMNNRPDRTISQTVERGVKQTTLNDIHTFYEQNVTSEFFYPIFKTMSLLNLFIHKMESFSDGKVNDSAIVDIAPVRPGAYHFKDSDYALFTKNWRWGELKLAYSQIGVPTMEAFQNKTRPTPQAQHDVGIMLGFVPDSIFEKHEELAKWLKTVGMTPNDPKNSEGYIPLGILKDIPISLEERLQFLKRLQKYKRIKSMMITSA